MRRIDVITIFPGLFEAFLDESIVGIAIRTGRLKVAVHDLRDWTVDPHRTVDDSPYGGGPGMVMKPEPLVAAIEALAGPKGPGRTARVIALSPQGERLDQPGLEGLAKEEALVLVCGRYEGVDERVRQNLATDEVSIGDYVLTGGELAAMVTIDAVTRLLPGVLGDPSAIYGDSHARGLLEGPHYTRPAVFRGWEVPEILRSGDHAAVARWRHEQALRRTFERRPDLLARADLSPQDQEFLARLAGW